MHTHLKRAVLAIILVVLMTAGTVLSQDACNLSGEGAYIDEGYGAWLAKDYARAAAVYTCALTINSGSTTALFYRAYSYAEMGDYDRAMADYNTLLQLDPKDGPAYNNRGNLFYQEGDYEKALADYDLSIEMGGRGLEIPFYNRGLMRYEMGDYEQAIADLSESIYLLPAYADAYLARAGVYEVMDNSAAYADWAEWVELIRQQTIEPAGDSGALRMSEGLVYEISFEAEAGQVVRAAARTRAGAEVDPLIVILGTDSRAVAGDDDSGVNLDAVVRYETTSNGTYTLLVTHAGGGSEGEILLTLTLDGKAISGGGGEPEAPATTFEVFDLTVNDTAVVFTTERDRLNVRSGPGLDFEIVTKLQRDSLVTLLEGPRKADGYAWWRIRMSDGTEGWAVERVETEQTLQPALILGRQAVVKTLVGDGVRMRAGAGTTFEILTIVPDGTLVTLLEGPQTVDGLPWWRIRTPDGAEGWAVERVGDERTLSRKADQE